MKIVIRTEIISIVEDNEFIYKHIKIFYSDVSVNEQKETVKKNNPTPPFIN